MNFAAMPDEKLLHQLQEGDEKAFTQLVERHSTRFYRLAYRFTADREEAEDIVQEAFVKLWERPAMWDAARGAKFTTWFYRIVLNASLSRRRKNAWFRSGVQIESVPSPLNQEEGLAKAERQKKLEAAIASLPARQQAALNLCFYEELSNAEAAEIMQIKVKALESLLMRAKTSLKKSLGAGE